ncbi:MAG: hypothetical protein ABI382_14065, partial [Nakamurella sp.]
AAPGCPYNATRARPGNITRPPPGNSMPAASFRDVGGAVNGGLAGTDVAGICAAAVCAGGRVIKIGAVDDMCA